MEPAPKASRRVDVLGVAISATNLDGATRAIAGWIDRKATEYVCLTPVSGVMAAQRDPDVARALNGAGLTLPDGMPMVWSGKYAGAPAIQRVYGPDLMATVCAEAGKRGWSNFLYGGAPGTVDRLADRLKARFPGLRVAGKTTPPFRTLTEAERADAAAEIDRSGADLVWVGLSTPKQDLWMADMVGRLEKPAVLVGVGAAFDIHAGLRKQPPAWMGPLGLFWLYRLIQEPRRLGRRYLADIPQFLWAVARRRPFLRPG